jgi:hypothetical protein
MPISARHKRQRQSELCRNLARLATDGEVRARLIQTANEYLAEATCDGVAAENSFRRNVTDRPPAPKLAYD